MMARKSMSLKLENKYGTKFGYDHESGKYNVRELILQEGYRRVAITIKGYSEYYSSGIIDGFEKTLNDADIYNELVGCPAVDDKSYCDSFVIDEDDIDTVKTMWKEYREAIKKLNQKIVEVVAYDPEQTPETESELSNEAIPTEMEIEFNGLVTDICEKLNVKADISLCDIATEYKDTRFIHADGLCTYDPETHTYKIEISSDLVGYWYRSKFENDDSSTFVYSVCVSVERVICHELAHLKQWRHGKKHQALTDYYMSAIEESDEVEVEQEDSKVVACKKTITDGTKCIDCMYFFEEVDGACILSNCEFKKRIDPQEIECITCTKFVSKACLQSECKWSTTLKFICPGRCVGCEHVQDCEYDRSCEI